MASIKFYANNVAISSPSGTPTLINHGAGSGIGMFGAGYAISIPVGEYNDTTWVTNANGTATDQYQLSNTKYMSVSGMSHNGSAEISNRKAPNYYAPLNIRFEHSEAVRVQNVKIRAFDRNNIARMPSGVVTQFYEIRHPNGSESASGLKHRGVTDAHAWVEFDPAESMFDMSLTSSPGMSGYNTSSSEVVPSSEAGFVSWITQDGAAHESTRHDWYLGMSCSPDSIGSKTDFALWCSCEYL